jgi:hypothetical protein
MSLLFVDGFDHYASADALKKGWASIDTRNDYSIDSTGGRRGGGAMKFTQASVGANNVTTLAKSFAAVATVVFGFAFKTTETSPGSTSWNWALGDGSSTQLCFVPVVASGQLEVYRGDRTTLLGTSAASSVNWGVFTYIEVKATINDSTGSVIVEANGVEILNLSGIDTKATANAQATYLAIGNCSVGSISLASWFDDLYILNTSGSAPQNDFLGDCRVDPLYPNADGNYSAWTPSTGVTHYTLVDEATPNTSDYVESSTSSQKDSYGFGNLSATTGTIFGVQLNIAAHKTDAGSKDIKALTRIASTDYLSSAIAVSTDQTYLRHIWEENPNAAAAWTEAAINGAEFGVECQ